MKGNRIFLAIFSIIILLFCFWYFYLRTAREKKLMREGDEIIEKIEYYKSQFRELPNSLTELGIYDDNNSFSFYYQKQDSLYYSISFGMSMDYSKVYYSDTRTWEDNYRKMGIE